MKKNIAIIFLAASCAFASGENKILSYNFTNVNDITLKKATVVDYTLDFKAAEVNQKEFPIAFCKNEKSDIQQKSYLANDSIILSCKASLDNKSTNCTLKVFNVNNDDKKIQDILNKKTCNNYAPKQIVNTFSFVLNVDSEKEIVLDNKYKFKYKLYSAD